MNSANAFSYAISGSYTEAQMAKHAEYINQNASMFQQAGGWLAEQANRMLTGFNNFMNSRAWEMGKRLLNHQDGEYVGQFEIGYLGSLAAIQGARGYMRDYIMAHPGLMQDYLLENIEGYGGEFNVHCKGIKEDNLFYRRAMNGLLNMEKVEDKTQLRHTHYYDTIGGAGPSFRERVDVMKTWVAVDHHRAKGMFDMTSEAGNKRKDYIEPEDLND